METTQMTPGEDFNILKRRKWSLILPFLIVFIIMYCFIVFHLGGAG